jgi:hypothetical protein
VNKPTAEIEFRECYLATGQYAGVQTLVGWSCSRCGVLVPNITDVPDDVDSPRTVHRAWHEERDQ